MEVISFLADGILLALEPINFALIIVGVTVGLFIGAMPGLGSVNGVAILLPITFLVPPNSAIILARCMAGRFPLSHWGYRAHRRPWRQPSTAVHWRFKGGRALHW